MVTHYGSLSTIPSSSDQPAPKSEDDHYVESWNQINRICSNKLYRPVQLIAKTAGCPDNHNSVTAISKPSRL